MTSIVRADDVGRWYGQVAGLVELSVELAGGVTGLVGPNGAGKSTFLKLMVGEIRPSRGSIRVLGQRPFGNRRLLRRIGFAPQQDAFYGDMSGEEFVRFLLRLSGMSSRRAKAAAHDALDRVDMSRHMRRRISGYSKGMRQRVKMAQAIAHHPELLICDEPLGGLDPVGRRDMIGLLRELAGDGTHIVISSHILHEVEELAETIVLLHRGRRLAQGKVAELRQLLTAYPHRVEIGVRDYRRLAERLIVSPRVRSVEVRAETAELAVETQDVDGFHKELTRVAGEQPMGIRHLKTLDDGLEAVFDYLIG